MQIRSAKDLIVYPKAYQLTTAIFEASKHFPPEERCALTGQIRRSSRDPGFSLNVGCAWYRKAIAGGGWPV